LTYPYCNAVEPAMPSVSGWKKTPDVHCIFKSLGGCAALDRNARLTKEF
jgi:hypothetical protein